VAAEDFFNRWATREKNLAQAPLAADESTMEASPAAAKSSVEQAVPGMEDVVRLNDESDFSVFMRQGVDENVKRSAMKKLFSNPHFNVMDRLDIYIDDYSQPDPLPPGMLAALRHAETLLDPLRHLEIPLLGPLPQVVRIEDEKLAKPEMVDELDPEILLNDGVQARGEVTQADLTIGEDQSSV
jgi:hypothetical protein